MLEESPVQDTSPNTPLLTALLDTSFTEFITLKLLKFIYILGLIGIVLSIGVTALAAFSQGFLYGIGGLIVGVIAIVLSALVLRVYMELIAVVFRIAKNTREIADNTARSGA